MAVDRSKLKNVEPANRAEWREWLQKNHQQKENIWLVMYKKGHEGSTLVVSEAVEEALCFGWIDSTANKLDEKRFKIQYSPRKPKSIWSQINKARVAKLIKDGLMQPAGLAMVQLAKRTGTWKALNDIDKLKYPLDLVKALSKNKQAKKYFDAFPPSTKKMILYWIESSRTSETRIKRIRDTVKNANKNIRANQYIRKS